jgi:hypothetical protein
LRNDAILPNYSRGPEPSVVMVNWVCRDNLDHLDLMQNRLDLKYGLTVADPPCISRRTFTMLCRYAHCAAVR